MQIRRARSFGLTQLCAYLKNGGHRLSTDLAVEMCVSLKGYYTLDTCQQSQRSQLSLVYLMKKGTFGIDLLVITQNPKLNYRNFGFRYAAWFLIRYNS